MKGQLRRAIIVLAPVVLVLSAAVLALALSAPPAPAYTEWAHDGAQGCSCHGQGTPTDASCASCHSGFQSPPDLTCWSCHAPGQDTSSLSTPSSACGQECHLWNTVQKAYLTPTTHGANPHLGSTSACLDCHPTSASVFDPGSSPHHTGQATGFTQCGVCHSSAQRHAGKVACTSCHTDATAFHLFQASSPGFKRCGACHTKRHAGKKVATSKCAACHKGTGGRTAQHSSSVTRKYVCGGCHGQKLHARSFSSAITSCRSCHGGKYHAGQKLPGKSVCTRCHTAARNHANGFQCKLCHAGAVHKTRPSAAD